MSTRRKRKLAESSCLIDPVRWIVVLLFCLPLDPTMGQEPKFEPLFNGRDLTGWKGDMRFWRVEEGAIVGQTTTDVSTKKNTFLIYDKEEFGNFELRFEFRVAGGNSGIQYRSQLIKNWVVKGLQADFEDQIHEGKDRFTGMFFEENGRMFMGQRGEVVVVKTNSEEPRKPQLDVVGSVGDAAELEKHIRRGDWNEYTVIAHEHTFVHIVNGHVMSVGIDLDDENFRESGLLAWQLHAGPPLKIEMKNIRLRRL